MKDSESGTISSKKILCAIISHAKSTRRETIRNTWLPLVPPEVDVKFFVGAQEGELEDDVINLHCCDHHEGIPDKIREICRWAREREYEFMWKVDDDVQLVPNRLVRISSPFTAVILPGAIYPSISGFLYGFNREGIEVLSASDTPYYPDEYWVADKLGSAGIPCTLISLCGVVHYEFQKAFPPYWVVAVHGESVASRSLSIFKQLNGFEQPDLRRRLRRKM